MAKNGKAFSIAGSITRKGHWFRRIIWALFIVISIMVCVNGYVAVQYFRNAKDPKEARVGLLTSTFMINAFTALATFLVAYFFGTDFALEDDYLTNLTVLTHQGNIDRNLRRALSKMLTARGLSADAETSDQFYENVRNARGVPLDDREARMTAAELRENYDNDPGDSSGRIPYWDRWFNSRTGKAKGMVAYEEEYKGEHPGPLIDEGRRFEEDREVNPVAAEEDEDAAREEDAAVDAAVDAEREDDEDAERREARGDNVAAQLVGEVPENFEGDE